MKRRKFIKTTGGLFATIGVAPLAFGAQKIIQFPVAPDECYQTHACLPIFNEAFHRIPAKGDLVAIWVKQPRISMDQKEVQFAVETAYVTQLRPSYSSYKVDGADYHIKSMVAVVKPIKEGVSMKDWETSRFVIMNNAAPDKEYMLIDTRRHGKQMAYRMIRNPLNK